MTHWPPLTLLSPEPPNAATAKNGIGQTRTANHRLHLAWFKLLSHGSVRSFRLHGPSPRTRTSHGCVLNIAGSPTAPDKLWEWFGMMRVAHPRYRQEWMYSRFRGRWALGNDTLLNSTQKGKKKKRKRASLRTHDSALRVYYRLSSIFHNGRLQPRLNANEQWGLYFYMSSDRRITTVCIKYRMSSTVETGWGWKMEQSGNGLKEQIHLRRAADIGELWRGRCRGGGSGEGEGGARRGSDNHQQREKNALHKFLLDQTSYKRKGEKIVQRNRVE